jgi:HD-GYP domain-containing protein (c-di-GMP phosphodiesterase class II)
MIPIESRIISVCDAYSAMTTDRPYRAALPISESLAELQRCAGSQFDRSVVNALLDTVKPGQSPASAKPEVEPSADHSGPSSGILRAPELTAVAG